MRFFNRLTAIIAAASLLAPVMPLEARTRKGDRYLSQGRSHEDKKEWDLAVESYDKALAEDPADVLYRMADQKARFQAGQYHVDQGLKIRMTGQLGEALLEFQKALGMNPGSSIAAQEVGRTQEMILRERRRVEETGREAPPEVRGLTPVEQARKDSEDKIRRILPVPELKPLDPTPLKKLTINAQPVKVLFETVAKLAGINIIWDPDYTPPTKNSLNIDFENTTLEEALDYIALISKSYWKALSSNTIFITNDNTNKRRDYGEMVAQTFYISNVNTPQELQEIVNVVRSVSELQRVTAYNAQNAIIVRGDADQVALAEKMIHDLDKPKAEVVVDILVMEATTTFSRALTAAIASNGLNVPANFTPRSGLTIPSSTTTSSSSSSSSTTTGSTTTGTTTTPTPQTSTSANTAIPLSNLGHLSSADFSITLPGALLQATLSDTKTKVLQAPQIRSLDNVKATLKIGEREPTATGSFQPGIGGVGINPLVNTQFTYIDVGVNVELQPKIHDNGDVSMHIDLDISTVAGHVNLGGIDQPIIGQRKVVHDIRMHEGEVNLLGGLINQQDSKQLTGIPGLSSIPLLGKLFSGSTTSKERNELMIAIIPHIVRRPEYSPEQLRAISTGTQSTLQIRHSPKQIAPAVQAPAPGAAPAGPPSAANAMPAAGTTAPQTAVVTPSTTTSAAGQPPATAPPVTAPPAVAPGFAPPATAPPATAPTPSASTTQPASNAVVQFSPSQVETSVSSNVTVALTVEGAADLASAPIQITFDPKILQLNNVTPGGLLGVDGQQPIFTKNVMNENGSATIQIARGPNSPGVTAAGVLLTLTFQTVGRGAAKVSAPNLTLRNSQGQVIATASPQLTVTVK